jgi:hypothetical protein
MPLHVVVPGVAKVPDGSYAAPSSDDFTGGRLPPAVSS